MYALFNIFKKLKNVLFYGCVAQKSYKMLSTPLFYKG